MQQYIYRLIKLEDSSDASSVSNCHILVGFKDWLSWFFPLLYVLGTVETLKVFIQWFRQRKTIYFYAEDRRIQSYGIISFGYCKLYPIEQTAAVIGPVNTLATCQGRGLATRTLRYAVNWLLMQRSCSAVYIDTAETNLPMQRVINKVGFTGPIDTFPRN